MVLRGAGVSNFVVEDAFPAEDFDLWADTYDTSVATNQGFPFESYAQVLELVVQLADTRHGMPILDLGTGTGQLAARFDALGCNLWCTDFSEAMLAKARMRLPKAHFARHDLRQVWLSEWQGPFERIISAYVFHHFEDNQKIELVKTFTSDLLAPGGSLLIADISFRTPEEMAEARLIAGQDWEEELYWVAENILPRLQAAGLPAVYHQVSYCAGVYFIQPRKEARIRY
jgi:putative AdoMet-dependent methyltransferase